MPPHTRRVSATTKSTTGPLATPLSQHSPMRPAAPRSRHRSGGSTVVILPPPHNGDFDAQVKVAKVLLRSVARQKGYKHAAQWNYQPTTADKCPHTDGDAIPVRWVFSSTGSTGATDSSNSTNPTGGGPTNSPTSQLDVFKVRFMGCPSCADQDWVCIHAFNLVMTWEPGLGKWSDMAIEHPDGGEGPSCNRTSNQTTTEAITGARESKSIDKVLPTRKRLSSSIEGRAAKKQAVCDKRQAKAMSSKTLLVDTSDAIPPAFAPSRSTSRPLPKNLDVAEPSATVIRASQRSTRTPVGAELPQLSTADTSPDQADSTADKPLADFAQRGKAALAALHDAKWSMLKAEMVHQSVSAELEAIRMRLASLASTKRKLEDEQAVLEAKMANSTAAQRVAQALQDAAQAEADKWCKERDELV